MSGRPIWLGPSDARLAPACEPTSFRFAPLTTPISIWSYARVMNFANDDTNGIFPDADSPTATDTMFCSAIRHSRNRLPSCGSRAKCSANVEFDTSPSSATTRSFRRPSSCSAIP